ALGYLLLNAEDFKTCIECLCRYVRLQCDGISFSLTEDAMSARVVLVCAPTFVAPRKQFHEFVMELLAIRFRQLFGPQWSPLKVEFEYRRPNCAASYTDVFGANVEFECPSTALTMRSDTLRDRNHVAEKNLFDVLRSAAERELAGLDRSRGLLWRVDEYVANSLTVRSVSLESCAATVELSSRRLQSELKRLGTTFEDEVSRVRRSLAERYLLDTDMALTEIALLLGFSELSAFTRAARGWFGMPPSQWRSEARAGRIAVDALVSRAAKNGAA
ncbi:MAG: AraC family transcriptional regulator ligand-binding domain-containing protein, partial [Proteobacteria bacterium]|nr:AraC family transcriptional regulator ligand-binding domain-containing protein [Pseudomonadota bacterium]